MCTFKIWVLILNTQILFNRNIYINKTKINFEYWDNSNIHKSNAKNYEELFTIDQMWTLESIITLARYRFILIGFSIFGKYNIRNKMKLLKQWIIFQLYW